MDHREMFGGAHWLGFDGRVRAPLVRASFDCHGAVRAQMTVCGLGYAEIYLNGRRISEDLFVPATSDYCPRDIRVGGKPFDERFRHRCYCLEYDVMPYLREGRNELAAALAPGFFAQDVKGFDSRISYGEVRVCWRLVMTDARGEVTEALSGEDARWDPGEITECDLFRGESADLDLCPADWTTADFSHWRTVRILPPMDTDYERQDCPADRIVRTLTPVLLEEGPRGRLYDLGENVTGWVILRDRGEKGGRIEVRFGEMLDARGLLDSRYTHGQRWRVVSDGTGRVLRPRTTWFGFRYFTVEGDAEVVCAAVIHMDTPPASSFRCASPVLNWLYEAYVRTQTGNLHGGIPSDCPHIERRGYTGDGQLTCEAAMLTLDCRTTMRKWMRDILDCQDPETGHVQYTAPYTRCGGGPGGWGIAVITVPLTYYEQYGDPQPLGEMYDGMVRYLGYLDAHSEGGLVVSDREGEWCLGDWCTPDPIRLPPPYVNTYFKVRALDAMRRIDRILGREEDPRWKARREEACGAIVARYFDPQTHDFASGVQGANAFALDIGLGDEVTLAHFLSRYESTEGYDTGIFGTEIVTRLLGEKGRYDLEYRLLAAERGNSFGAMMREGATTLWEYWPRCEYQRSMDHPMFGAVCKLLFYDALGLRRAEDGAGWRRVRIEPRFLPFLPQAEGHIQTPRGRLAVSYRRTLTETVVTAEIPEGTEAELVFGGGRVPLSPGVHRRVWRHGLQEG